MSQFKENCVKCVTQNMEDDPVIQSDGDNADIMSDNNEHEMDLNPP